MEKERKRKRGPYKRKQFCAAEEDFTPSVQGSDPADRLLDHNCFGVEDYEFSVLTAAPSTSFSFSNEDGKEKQVRCSNTCIVHQTAEDADTDSVKPVTPEDITNISEPTTVNNYPYQQQDRECQWINIEIPEENQTEQSACDETECESMTYEDFAPSMDEDEEFLYDSDFESEKKDDDSDSDLLYPGAHVTVGAFMLLLAVFFTKHNIPGEGIQQLLNVIAYALPVGHKLCTSLKDFKSFFQQLKNPIFKHYYCNSCLGYFGKEKKTVCPYPSCQKSNDGTDDYFLEMPLELQLQSLFSQDGFYSSLQRRFTRTANGFNDIYDGSLYKTYYENNGPLSDPNNISFTFNTDGASVFKSSNVSVWPLFLVINELPYNLRMKAENMILAGLWFGKKKPFMGSFLQPFLQVFKRFSEGVKFFSKEKGQFVLKAFLLCGTSDLPARSLLCNSVQYNGAYSCWKCLQKGETASVGKGHCHIFPFQEDGPKLPARTKESVIADSKQALDNLESGQKQHSVNGIKGPSWLLFFPLFDIVNGIGIDYMHGILLGVQKLLLNLWFSTVHKGKGFNYFDKVKEVDHRLMAICPTLNISRLPRSIQLDLKYWKASEYRSFLLYFGAPVLKGILDKERFLHYLYLVNAVHILLKDGCSEEEIAQADLMLIEFVRQFCQLYNPSFMTLNMHQLVHLVDGVRMLGPLFTHSCFPFEDKNGVLLKMIKGTQNIDNQIITGVSFLQKIPELKLKTIQKGTDLEKLYNSIEHPSVLSRGKKLADNVHVLGAIKKRPLTDTENAAICSYFGYDPVLSDSVEFFNRLEFHDDLIYGTSYSRMKKRDNSTVSYLHSGQENFGRVKHFVIIAVHDEVDRNVFAIVDNVQCQNYSTSRILHVSESGTIHAVPLQHITGSCMFVSFIDEDGSKIAYVCKFPNRLESD